jgi:hypothetical protein
LPHQRLDRGLRPTVAAHQAGSPARGTRG